MTQKRGCVGAWLMGFCLASSVGDSSLVDPLSVSLHLRTGLLAGRLGRTSFYHPEITCFPSVKYLKRTGCIPSLPPHPVGQVSRAVKLVFEGLRRVPVS